MAREGRKGRAARAAQGAARRVEYGRLRHPFPPVAPLSGDEVAGLHDAALRVLEDLGLSVLLPEAREVLRKAGARVEEDMVFIGRDMVDEALRTAPRRIRMRARNPAREQDYGPGTLMFAPAGGCPNVADRDRGRRPGDLASYREAVRLVQAFDAMHKAPGAPEPQDVALPVRHLATVEAQMTLTDKPLSVFARGSGQARDVFEMIRLGYGLSDDDFLDGVWTSTVINTNSPRRLDTPMAQGIIDFARAGQMTIITPFCLAGAMAPVTLTGALVLQHAEALAGIVLAQMVRPGAPVSYGGFSSNVDLKSGAPAFGTPEHLKMQFGTGQMARHIGMPWRSAAGSASNAADAQGATENVMGLWGAVMAGATIVVHSAGWLEGGLTFGFEKFVTDMEAVQTIAEIRAAPAPGGEDAFAAIAEVAPGGHFLGAGQTMERFASAFYPSLNGDLSPFGTWQENGALRAEDRATEVWRAALERSVPPAGAGEIAERLAPFVARRRAEGGAPPLED